MAEQLCPVCGCHITGDASEQNGVLYCCQPCADGGQCQCGCCEREEIDEEQEIE